MKRFVSLALLAAVALIGGCGGDTHESISVEGVTAMKDLTAALEGVKNEASAKAAVSKIESIATRFQDLRKRKEALPKPSKEEEAALKQKYQKEMADLFGKMMEAGMKLEADPAIKKILDPAMEKLGKALDVK